jgi:hypothetical protein
MPEGCCVIVEAVLLRIRMITGDTIILRASAYLLLVEG